MSWPPQKIVVGCDFSPASLAALRAAAALAHRTGGSIDLLHVLGTEPLERNPRGPAEAVAQLEKHVKEIDAPRTRIHVPRGSAFDELLALRELGPADLVVVGAEGQSRLRRWWLGSVADRLLRRPGCPLLLVRRVPVGAEFKVIAVGLERGVAAELPLRCALLLANTTRAELSLVHALWLGEAEGKLTEAVAVERELSARAKALDPTVPIEVHTRPGDPALVLPRIARELRAQLVVVGARRARDGWPGRVADRVARSGLPAVLVAWPPEEGSADFAGE